MQQRELWPLSGPNRRELHLAIGSPSRLPQGVRKFRQTNMCNEAMENPRQVDYNCTWLLLLFLCCCCCCFPSVCLSQSARLHVHLCTLSANNAKTANCREWRWMLNRRAREPESGRREKLHMHLLQVSLVVCQLSGVRLLSPCGCSCLP